MPRRNFSHFSCGIYSIKHRDSGRIYVGSAKYIELRWKDHICQLNKRKHANIHLQRAWDIHSESAFDFCILETCPIELLIEREQFWMDTLKSVSREHGYNIIPRADRHFYSEESKKRLSESHMGQKAWNKGIKCPEEVRARISETKKKAFRDDPKLRLWMVELASRNTKKFGNKWTKRFPVVQLSKEGVELNRFESVRAALRHLGKGNIVPITSICKGYKGHNTAYGYKWKYANG